MGGDITEDPSRLPFDTSQAPELRVVVEEPRDLYARFGKRLLDLLIVAVAAPVWLVMYALIALLILLLDGRPIHHRSARVGAGGEAMKVLKFRTMRRDAHSDLHTLLASDPGLKREFKETFKLRNDPRVTPLGRWLRRLSLDELPQLLNVVTGSMSLVGPRPVVRSELDDYYGENATVVLSVRPGLTGLWQVSGRSLLSYDDRVALDVAYVSTSGLATDLRILARTVPSVFRGHGAF
jgi:exopolysaccharide production protein ExoY